MARVPAAASRIASVSPEIRGDEFRVCGQWIGEGRDIRQAERPTVLSQQRDNAPRNLAGCPSQQNGARIVSHVSYGSRIIDPVVLRAARSRYVHSRSRVAIATLSGVRPAAA